MRTTPLPMLSGWLAILCLPGGLEAQSTPAPFDPGVRWEHTPDPSIPWIPRDLVFGAGGELLWAAPAVGNPSLQLFATADISAPGVSIDPLFEDTNLAGAISEVRVAAGDSAAELFAVAQYPSPTTSQRSTVVTRYNAEAAAAGSPFMPVWSHTFTQLVNGPARIAAPRDGSFLAAGIFDSGAGQVHIDVIETGVGVLINSFSLTATGLDVLALAGDGSHLVVGAGSYLYLLDEQGSLVFQLSAPFATLRPSLSGDAVWLAAGSAGLVELYQDSGAGHRLVHSFQRPKNQLCTGTALSDDGSTLAVTWWDAANGEDVWLDVFDVATGNLLNAYEQLGSSSGLQNFPEDVQISADGTRIVAGFWGAGDGRPEWVLLERGNPVPEFEMNLAGSVEALALDEVGGRLGIAAKDSHANLFSALGSITLFDTGERDLQLTTAAALGSTLSIFVELPEPGTAIFSFGLTLATPVPYFNGLRWIDLNPPFFTLSTPTSQTGRASVDLMVAHDPSLIGLSLGIQAVGVGASGVSVAETLIRPRFL